MKRIYILLALVLILAGCTRYEAVEIPSTSPAAEREQAEGIDPAVEETIAKDAGQTSTGQPDKIAIADEMDDRGVPLRNPVKVKGIYVSAYVAGTRDVMDKLTARVEQTEINAMVIDFKDDDGRITCGVDSPLINEIGSSKIYVGDMKALVADLKAKGIYTIARVVTFKDPFLAEQKPEWSLKTTTGEVYRDKDGLAWVDPYHPEVWNYLIEVGRQAQAIGFDEIQFDYIRFATDKTMQNVAFDEALTAGRSKTDIVTEFTQYAYQQLAPMGIFVSADVFGAIIGSEQDAGAVGQDYGAMAAHLDYICPMIYPSHYGEGNFGLDYPDKHPYETILAALQGSRQVLLSAQVPGKPQAKVRPWLQDFTASYLKNYIKYGPDEIKAQIQAVEDAGYEEWILWNASCKYTWDGLEQVKE